MTSTGFVENNNCKVAVYEKGSKADRTILFLHGNSESALIFKEQFHSALAESFHLIAFDLPGHGSSSPASNPEQAYRIPDLVKLTGKFIEYLNQPVVIAGSSLGGHIALEVSNRYPQLVKGLFLDACPPVRSASDFGNAYLSNSGAGILFQDLINDEELKQLSTACILNSTHRLLFEDLVKNTDSRFRAVLSQSVLNNEMEDEIAIAEKIPMPIAILHGEADKIVNKDYYNTISFATLWRSQIHVISKAAHLPCLENPEVYNDLLLEFMKDVSDRLLKCRTEYQTVPGSDTTMMNIYRRLPKDISLSKRH